MSRLYLRCAICSRQQAEGLISRAAWGRLELQDGSALRACPTCISQYPDWQSRVLSGLDLASGFGSRAATP